MALVPKLRVPFDVVGGSVAVVEQDSAREIEQCIHATLSTPQGSRLEAPDFGCPKRLFDPLSAAAGVDPYLAAIDRDEPRAHALGTREVEDMVERIAFRRETVGG